MVARTRIGLLGRRFGLTVFVIVAATAVLSASCAGTPNAGSSEPPPVVATAPVADRPDTRPKIVAFGDSLTAGYGLTANDSYPAQLQRLLDTKGYQYEVVNAGVSGETTAGGLRRIDSALEPDVRVVIVALGGNDALRGLPVAELKSNLEGIVDKAKARGAKVLLAGMEAPPMMGPAYTAAFRDAYAEIGREKKVEVVPFLLEGVAGRDELNQQDGIHPNTQGAGIVAATVFKQLAPMIERTAGR